jgi:hypothetical protein
VLAKGTIAPVMKQSYGIFADKNGVATFTVKSTLEGINYKALSKNDKNM